MNEYPVRKTAGLPSMHPGAEHRDEVDAAVFDRLVSSDSLEALASKELASAGNIVNVAHSVVVHYGPFPTIGAGYPQLWHGLKFFQQVLQIIGFKRNISIKIPN